MPLSHSRWWLCRSLVESAGRSLCRVTPSLHGCGPTFCATAASRQTRPLSTSSSSSSSLPSHGGMPCEAVGEEHTCLATPYPRALPPARLASSSFHHPLTRRTERQLEQQYGPMWRYIALVADTTVDTAASGKGHRPHRGESAPDEDSRRQLLVERAREVGLIEPAVATGRGSAAQDGAEASPFAASSLASSSSSSTAAPATEDVATAPPVSTDPLLAFLEKNEEDAAILLAMWASLRRSCLHASEISESLSLRVRYFFHSLIHRRAIAAAFELYQRLVYLGIQLKNSDLLLLLSNLPYEHSTAEAATVEEWRGEGAEKEKDRLRRVQREASIAAEESKASQRRKEAERRTMQRQREGQTTEAANGGADKTVQGGNTAEHPTGERGVQLHVLQHQPEWVKRWVLYEASMGNLDLYGDETMASRLSADADAIAGRSTEAEEESALHAKVWPDNEPAHTQDMVRLSNEASRLMEMTALLRHLYLLQVTARVRHQWLEEARAETAPRRGGAERVPHWPAARRQPMRVRGAARSSPRQRRVIHQRGKGRRRRRDGSAAGMALPALAGPSAASRFWREGLQLLTNFLQKSSDESLSAVHFDAHGGASRVARMPPALPPALLEVVHDIVRASDSWKASYAFAQLLRPFRGALSDRDILLFFRLAVASGVSAGRTQHTSRQNSRGGGGGSHGEREAPWESHRDVEAFVNTTLIPLVPVESAAGYAIQATWLCHLCSLKPTDPEAFLTMLATVAEMWALGPECTSVASLIGHAVAKAKLSTSLLLVEASRFGRAQRAQAVLAASIRTGIFSDDRKAAQSAPLADALLVRAEETAAVGDGALLSPQLLDAFVLACHSVGQTLKLSLLAASRGGDTAVLALQDFLEGTVYGPFSLWATFSQVYMENEYVANPRKVLSAPERGYVAALLAVTLLRVARELCQSSLETAVRSQVRLLLQLAATAVEQISSRHAKEASAPLPSWEEQEYAALKQALAALCKPLLSQMNLTRPNERALFGVVASESVDCLALYTRLVAKVETLPLSSTTKVPFVSLLTPKTRRLLTGMCFAKTNALGRRVRGQLLRREVADLDAWLLPRHRRAKHSTTTEEEEAPPDDATPIRRRLRSGRISEEEFERTVELRALVYAAVLDTENRSSPGGHADGALCALMDDRRSIAPASALTLCRILLCDIGAKRNTVSTSFFARALRAMAAAAAAEAPSVSFSWEDAVWLFWAAVDHTGPGRSTDATTGAQRMARHERDTFTTLLLPMLSFSNAIHRRDAGHLWRKQWASMFTKEERAGTEWRQRHLEALAALHDRNALRHATRLCTDTAGKEQLGAVDGGAELLCSIASSHRNWEEALQSLSEVFGTLETRESSKSPYPLPVVHAMLTVLAKSPTNLSNTGLRLRTIQTSGSSGGAPTTWDVTSSLLVLRLLLRSRRWRLALQVAKDTLELSVVQELALHVAEANKVSKKNAAKAGVAHEKEKDVMNYARLLLLSLQACAIGGQADDAAVFYDRFQDLLRVVVRGNGAATTEESSTPPPSASPQDNAEEEDMDLLERTLAKAHTGYRVVGPSHDDNAERDSSSMAGSSAAAHTSLPAVQQEELAALASRARALFFRAMTKKMMATPKAGKVTREGEEEKNSSVRTEQTG